MVFSLVSGSALSAAVYLLSMSNVTLQPASHLFEQSPEHFAAFLVKPERTITASGALEAVDEVGGGGYDLASAVVCEWG